MKERKDRGDEEVVLDLVEDWISNFLLLIFRVQIRGGLERSVAAEAAKSSRGFCFLGSGGRAFKQPIVQWVPNLLRGGDGAAA